MSTCRDSYCWKKSKRCAAEKMSWGWERRLLKSKIFLEALFLRISFQSLIHCFVLCQCQVLWNSCREDESYWRVVEEERTGCKDNGGHIWPETEEWTFKVFFLFKKNTIWLCLGHLKSNKRELLDLSSIFLSLALLSDDVTVGLTWCNIVTLYEIHQLKPNYAKFVI